MQSESPQIPEEWALGLDIGATGLRWAARRGSGDLREGFGAGANPQLLGWERYRDFLGEAIDRVLSEFALRPADISSLGLGLAGVDRADEIESLSAWARKRFLTLRALWIGNDALAALHAGAGKLEGIVLIAGTGSICCGVAADGMQVRVGGWGADWGDEGSAWWIGREAINRVAMMADGRVPATPLIECILQELGLREATGLIAWTAARDRPSLKRDVAAVAPAIIDLARQGDRSAGQIVSRAIDLLILHVTTVAQRLDAHETATDPFTPALPLGDRPPRIMVAAGGLLTGDDLFYKQFEETLAAHPCRLEIRRCGESAARGALDWG